MNAPPRRPSRIAPLHALVVFWASSVFAGACASYPFAKVAAATGVERLPAGDAALFAAGGTFLIEALRVGGRELSAAFESTLTVAVVGSFAMLVPLAALMVSQCRSRPARPAAWVARTVSVVPAFTLLTGITVLAQTVLAFFFLSVAFPLREAAGSTLSEPGADAVAAAWLALGLFAWLFVEILEDLARAFVVRRRRRALPALGDGLALFVASPLAVVRRWGAPALGCLVLVALGAVLVELLHVERAGAWRVLATACVHQTVIFGSVWLRAFWLSRALSMAGESP